MNIGLTVKALDAMAMAVRLSPHDRFLLRSAARLQLHADDPEAALWTLRNTSATGVDPWLVASEIAVSRAAGKSARFTKTGLSMLVGQRFAPFHTSELASALATSELLEGSTRKARRLFETSLLRPNENAVAQAEWAARKRQVLTFDPSALMTLASFEARAAENFADGLWLEALDDVAKWQADQPFAFEPPAIGSYIASTCLRDFRRGIEFTDFGLIANPRHWLLLNNKAFALATLGELEKAAAVFEKIEFESLEPSQTPTVLATAGLMQFRTSAVQAGREAYLRAISIFDRLQRRKSAALAAIYLAREEAIAGTDTAAKALLEAEERASAIDAPELPDLIEDVRQRSRATQDGGSK